jgi:hypothetical protein
MRRVGLASAAVAALAVGGCGGGGGGSKLYSLSATQSCLKRAGYQAVALPNSSLPGAAGNLRVRLATSEPALAPTALRGTVIPNQFVFLVFGKDETSALATENRAITLTIRALNDEGEQLTRAYVRSGVGLSKNVFFYSPSGPLTKTERTKVSSCLH